MTCSITARIRHRTPSTLHVQLPDGTFATPVPSVVPGGIYIDLNGDGRRDSLGYLNYANINRDLG